MNVRTVVASLPLMVACLAPAIGLAQTKSIPLRTLAATVTSDEKFTAPVGFRELPDGRVVVLDITEKRLVVLDSTLANATPLSRTGSGPGEFVGALFLIRGSGDSLLLGDMGSQRLLNIDPSGKMAGEKRVAESLSIESMAIYTGTPVMDRAGRIVYQGPNTRVSESMQFTTDSLAPILRWNLATNSVDTLARVHVSAPRMTMSGDPTSPESIRMSLVVDPFPMIDDWALLADGTLAVIRGSDYHIDWVAPDGQTTSTPAMPYTRVPLTDSVKQQYVINLKKASEMASEHFSKMPSAMAAPTMTQTDPDTWPEFIPSIQVRNAIAAPNGTLWLLAKRLKDSGSEPYVYDVIDRQGVVIEHVAVPYNHMVVGFGRNTVYLSYYDASKIAHLERAPFK